MPELPEAETIVRGLRATVEGRVIARAVVVRPDVLRVRPRTFQRKVRGRRIRTVERRAKKVVLRLLDEQVLVVGLGMTGRLLFLPRHRRPPMDACHPAVRLFLQDGGSILFDDTRRFGSVECLPATEWQDRSTTLGPEPLGDSYAPADLHRGLAQSRSPVRSWLLDQRRIAGVGNIYAVEALHRAGIHPYRPSGSLSAEEARRLHLALRSILTAAVEARGTTISDYRTATGAPGTFVGSLIVYGREGQPCTGCGTPVERIVFSNRSAFLCPTCQPEWA